MSSKTVVPAKQGHVHVIKVCLHPNDVQASLLLNFTTCVNAVHNTILCWSVQVCTARTAAVNETQDDGDSEGYIEGLDEPVWDVDSFPTSLSKFTLEKHVTAVQQDWFTWADDVPAQVFTEASYRVADAYSHFFTNIKENKEGKHKGSKSGRGVGFPKFKKRRTETDVGKQSITFKEKPDETWLSPGRMRINQQRISRKRRIGVVLCIVVGAGGCCAATRFG